MLLELMDLPLQRFSAILLLKLCRTLCPDALPDKTAELVRIDPGALVSESDHSTAATNCTQ